MSVDRTGSTSATLCAVTTHLPTAVVLPQLRRAPRLLVVRIAPALPRLYRASGRAVSPLDFSSVGRTSSRHASGHCVSRRDYLSSWLVAWLFIDYFAYAARLGASARRAARRRLLRLHHASGCLGTSLGSTRGSSRRSLSTTSPTPHAWVLRHIARLVAWFVVDYFAYAARPGASACRAARRPLLRLRRASGCLGMSRGWSSTTSPRPARRRLRHLRRASGCLGTSRGTLHGSSSTTSPTPHVRVPQHVAWFATQLVVDYFAYTARPGASARRVACHAARHRLLRAPQLHLAATLALLQPRRAS
jgi:hypothetical protein